VTGFGSGYRVKRHRKLSWLPGDQLSRTPDRETEGTPDGKPNWTPSRALGPAPGSGRIRKRTPRLLLYVPLALLWILAGCPLDEVLQGDQDISENTTYRVEVEITAGSSGGPANATVTVEYPDTLTPEKGTPVSYSPAPSIALPVRLEFSGERDYDNPDVISAQVTADLTDPEGYRVRIWYYEPGTNAPDRPRELLAEGTASATADITPLTPFTVTLATAIPY
jgi:hypothetical protein